MLHVLYLCLAEVPIVRQYVGNEFFNVIDIYVGAYPGERKQAILSLQDATSSINPAKQHYSLTANNGSDFVYVGSHPQFHPVDESVGTSIVAWDLLLDRKNAFGVCDGKLYNGQIPRHCKRGKSGTRVCDRERCNINLSDKHFGNCENGQATINFGVDYSVTIDCEISVFENKRTPSVIQSDVAALSLTRGEYNFEYNDLTHQIQIYEPVGTVENLVSLGIVGVLSFGLAAWLGWTKALNKLIIHPNADDTYALWERLAKVGLIVGDASWLAASVKVYHFAIEAHSFMPEALDYLLGDEMAATYCVWYLGIVCGMTLIVLYILLLAMIDTGTKMPPFIAKSLERGVRSCSTPEGCLAALVVTRWLFETVLLTALHISTPDALGRSFKDVVGIGIGLAIASVAGRDADTLLKLCHATSSRILIALCLSVIMGHVSVFMVYPCVVTSYKQNSASLPVAVTVAVQTSIAAALFHRPRSASRAEIVRHTAPQKISKTTPF